MKIFPNLNNMLIRVWFDIVRLKVYVPSTYGAVDFLIWLETVRCESDPISCRYECCGIGE